MMSKRTRIVAAVAGGLVLVGGGTAAAAASHRTDPQPHISYRIDNAACNALREGYRAGDVIGWLQTQYHQSAYAASAVTVHAVDAGCGR